VAKALSPLQFVEKDSIRASVKQKRVIFTVADSTKFDEAKAKDALAAAGFPGAKVIAAPS
jgi:hypothetical protein